MSSIRETAADVEKDRRAAPGLATMVGVLLGRGLAALIRLVWAWRVTLAWVVGFIWLSGRGLTWVPPLVALLLFVVTLYDGRYSAPRWVRAAAHAVLPGTADYRRWRINRAADRAVTAGNAWLRSVGLVPDDDIEYQVSREESDAGPVIEVFEPVGQVTTSAIIDAATAYRDRLEAVRVGVEHLGGAHIRMTFYSDDPLDEAFSLAGPARLDPATMSIDRVAVDELGGDVSLSFREVSGMVIGGLPGSGKTAGATSFLLPLALSDEVDLFIIDGKGGGDWEPYRDRCRAFISDGDDLESARDVLATVYDQMTDRLRSNAAMLGTSNFWNASLEVRQNSSAHFILLVVDECQTLFESAGRSKEEKATQSEILHYVSALVRKGRSAGVCVILMTQKPTSDSLPTAIRDNCARRIAFRLMTPESVTATLGALPEGAPSPREIPLSRKGGAVLASESGEMKAVRFGYLPEDVVKQLLK